MRFWVAWLLWLGCFEKKMTCLLCYLSSCEDALISWVNIVMGE